MKASELITRLEKLIKEHGDNDCHVWTWGETIEKADTVEYNCDPYDRYNGFLIDS